MQTHLGAQEAEAGEPHVKIQTYFQTTKGLRHKVMRYYYLFTACLPLKCSPGGLGKSGDREETRGGAACIPSMHSGSVCLP